LPSRSQSVAGCPATHSIVLVEAPDVDLAAALASVLHSGDALEIGNELELRPYELTPAQYGEFLRRARVAVLAANPLAVLITGGVFTLNADTKPYLLAAAASCPDCILGIHLYQALSDADLAWLTRLKRPIAVTEFGAPTRCALNGGTAQKAWIDAQWAQFARVPTIVEAVVYQHAVGPTCSDLDTFGIDGQPAAAFFGGGPR
jgi:hypothetical protein